MVNLLNCYKCKKVLLQSWYILNEDGSLNKCINYNGGTVNGDSEEHESSGSLNRHTSTGYVSIALNKYYYTGQMKHAVQSMNMIFSRSYCKF